MLATTVLLASLAFAVVTVAGGGSRTSPESGGGPLASSEDTLEETRQATDRPERTRDGPRSPDGPTPTDREPTPTDREPAPTATPTAEGPPATRGVPASDAPDGSVSPGPTADPAPTSSPLAALVIQGPSDGEVITFDVATAYGSAPPNSRIVRDVPLWFDQHAVANRDGSWLMQVPLSEGLNELKFRLGDDRSTEQTIRVTYAPTP